jgi:hypothetical protein
MTMVGLLDPTVKEEPRPGPDGHSECGIPVSRHARDDQSRADRPAQDRLRRSICRFALGVLTASGHCPIRHLTSCSSSVACPLDGVCRRCGASADRGGGASSGAPA